LHSNKNAAKEPAPLVEADRERLSRHYEKDVAALSELIGRDLVGLWLKSGDMVA